MKRTNSVTDALNTNKALVDVGDGIVIPLPVDGVFGGAQGAPGVGVPDGGTSGQVVQRTASGTMWATPSKELVGLERVDNTPDAEKPLSTPQALALTNKADLISGKIPASQIPDAVLIGDATLAPLINGPTTGAAIDARINTQVAPQVQQITASYIAGDRAVVDAAAAAVDASPKIVQMENETIPKTLADAKIYADQSAKSAAATVSDPALAAWRNALLASGTKPAQAIVIGDSISEGADAGPITNRWQTQVQKYLRQAYGVPRGAVFPFIPAMEATSGTTGWPVTRSGPDGTVVTDVNWGFGWRAAKVFAGGKVTFTFTGTSAAVMYTKASGVGRLNIIVDGGAPTVVDSNSVTNGPTSDSATWNTGPLAAGNHVIEVGFDPSTPSGITNVLVQGLLTWDGDEAAGIRFLDSAHSGFRSGNFSVNGSRVTANALKAAGGASLAIIGIGTNDTLYPAEFGNYRTNVERMITALRTTAGFDGSILLVHWYMTNQMTSAQWEPYGDILAQLAAADPKVSFLDMRRRMPDMPTPYTDPSGFGYYAGNVHPSARGYKHIADTIAAHLTNGR